MPELTIYMNCDTRFAINMRVFDLGANDEFIFAIKNYDYIESDYVYLYRARLRDIDENGEIIFKIPPQTSKRIKPGAFYNFALLANAYDRKQPTEYKKLTENGSIRIEYGAQDILVKRDLDSEFAENIVAAKLVDPDTVINKQENPKVGQYISGVLKEI
jgi:hypothetical protein